MSYATFSFILRIRTSQPGRIPEWTNRGVREGVPVRNDKVTLMRQCLRREEMRNRNNGNINTRSFNRRLFQMALPITIQSLMLALVAAADALMLGRIGQNEMTAVSLALLGAFVFHWPVLVVYACTCLDEVGKIPWVMIRFRKYRWVQNLTR